MSKEITRIVTVQMTFIEDEKDVKDKQRFSEEFQKFLKSTLSADDVEIKKIQDFLSDDKD